jgi:hypothetical protein
MRHRGTRHLMMTDYDIERLIGETMAEVLRQRLMELETLKATGAATDDTVGKLDYVRKLLVRFDMPSGGRRPGQGRPKGTKNDRTKAIAVELCLTGVTPLEVMIDAMRHYLDLGNRDKAVAIAKDAAPYMHPRLASIAHGGQEGAPPIKTESVLIYSGALAKGDESI